MHISKLQLKNINKQELTNEIKNEINNFINSQKCAIILAINYDEKDLTIDENFIRESTEIQQNEKIEIDILHHKSDSINLNIIKVLIIDKCFIHYHSDIDYFRFNYFYNRESSYIDINKQILERLNVVKIPICIKTEIKVLNDVLIEKSKIFDYINSDDKTIELAVETNTGYAYLPIIGFEYDKFGCNKFELVVEIKEELFEDSKEIELEGYAVIHEILGITGFKGTIQSSLSQEDKVSNYEELHSDAILLESI